MPGTAGAGHSAIYKSALFDDPANMPDLPKTVYEIFELGLKMGSERNCLGRRPWDSRKADWADRYEWETYGQVDDRRTRIGSGLMKLKEDGVIQTTNNNELTVGIWSLNRPGKSSHAHDRARVERA